MIAFLKEYLGKVILFLYILFVLLGIEICHNDLCLWDSYGNTIAGFATLISVYFLYITLNQQDRSFKQERFEITFFNLLENRKNIIEGVWVKCEDREGTTFKLQTYSGEEVWKRVCEELMCIKDSLSRPKYIGKMDDCLMYKEVPEVLCNPVDLIDDAIKVCYCKRVNYTYNITCDKFVEIQRIQNNVMKRKLYYELFIQHKSFYNESYLRFMKMLLSWLEKQKDDKYARILLAQMSKYELQILYCQSLIDEDFHQYLVRAKVDKLLEKEFECII